MISVIITTCNRARMLSRAVHSVLAQTHRDFELIVVDDGSTDATQAVMSDIRWPRLTCIRHAENLGAPRARNAGLRAASGEYIAFLDDDDEWLPQKLERQLEVLRTSAPEVGLVYSGLAQVSERSGRTAHRFVPSGEELRYTDIFRNVTFTTSVPLIRKRCLETVGAFDESLPGAQDKDLWIRIAKHYRFASVPDVLVRQYIHGKQITCSLQGKIDSKEKFLEKYLPDFQMNPEIYAEHLWRMGVLYCVAGRSAEGRRCFYRCLRIAPRRIGIYREIALSLLAPSRHRRRLSKRAVGHIDGIALYY